MKLFYSIKKIFNVVFFIIIIFLFLKETLSMTSRCQKKQFSILSFSIQFCWTELIQNKKGFFQSIWCLLQSFWLWLWLWYFIKKMGTRKKIRFFVNFLLQNLNSQNKNLLKFYFFFFSIIFRILKRPSFAVKLGLCTIWNQYYEIKKAIFENVE